MAVVDGRTGLEIISVRECWELLSLSAVGRVGLMGDSGPEIYPVNHVVVDRTILFRTDVGSKLHGLERTPSVCFQCDGLNMGTLTGWSVLVKGHAERAGGADGLGAGRSPRLWAPGEKSLVIRISPTEVTGRRVTGAEARRPS